MRRRIVLLMVMLALASTTTAVSAETGRTRIVPKDFHLGAYGEVGIICDYPHDLLQSNPSIGGACFGLDFGETTVTVTILDDEEWPRLLLPVSRYPDSDPRDQA